MTLREHALSASRWTASAVFFRAAVQFTQTAVLARLLAPSDFGLLAMSGTVVAVASLFADFGLSSALIHFPLPSKAIRSALYLLNIGVALLLALAMAAIAGPVAALYNQPFLTPVVMTLGLAFPLYAAGQQFRALAEKRLDFAALAKIDVTASVAGFGVAVTSALAGAGVYALVAGVLANAAVSSLLSTFLLGSGELQFRKMDFNGIGPFLGYGGHRVGEQVWNNLLQQADVFIASLSAGPGAVALYATPRNQCLSLANTIVNPVVTRVGLPIMARLQGSPDGLRNVYLKTMRFTASINFPLYGMLALFPSEVVTLFLGSQWIGAAPFLRIFALWGLIRSTGNPSGSLLYAVGMVRRAHAWNFFLLLATLPTLWFAERRWGLMGLAWTMLALQAGAFVAAWRFLIRPACGAGFIEYVNSLLPALLSASIAVGVGYAISAAISGSGHLETIACSAAACGTYLVASYALNRTWFNAMGELLRPRLKKLA